MFGGALYFGYLGLTRSPSAVAAAGASLAAKYAPVSYVTGAWFSMFYTFLFHQAYTHFCVHIKMVQEHRMRKESGEKEEHIDLMYVKSGGYKNREVAVVNTTVRNTMEQSLTLLPLLWMCATLGGEDGVAAATTGGWIWVITRAYYPIAYAAGMPWLFLSTIPGYCAQSYLLFKIIAASF